MKRKISFSSILHNDRLILVISFILAIVVWSTVVYGPSNEQERTISGVPVTVSLGEYATDTLNMQLVDGHDFVASVRVYGRRSIVEQLSAQDILLTVDTSSIVSPGTYSGLFIKASKNGRQTDFEILSVEPAITTLTCDIWTEATFQVQAQIPGISSADETKYQLGTPVVSSDAMENSTITITGPKTEVDAIASIFAVTEEEQALTSTQVFDATLKAVDENGEEVDISHCTLNSENAPVKITVPILSYKRLELNYTLTNAPDAYADKKDLVSFSPAYLEVWGDEQIIADFELQVQKLCTFDFNALSKDKLQQELKLNVPETLKIVNGVDAVTAKFHLSDIISKTFSVNLSGSTVINCPDGLSIKPVDKTLTDIVVCGPASAVNKLRAKDLLVTIDVNNEETLGQRTLVCQVYAKGYDTVWVFYGDVAPGYNLPVIVTKK